MTCSNCQGPLPEGARFCSNCGTPVAPADQETTGALTPVTGPEDTGPQPVVGADYAVLVVHYGSSEGTAFRLNPPSVRVGRAADQQVFLDDITVSRHHAELKQTDDGWTIKDLGSLNGTYINRKPVTEAVLANGDEVQIGKYRFRFMSGAGGSDS